MRKTSKQAPTAEEIAEMASLGEDVSRYFTNRFSVAKPTRAPRTSEERKAKRRPTKADPTEPRP